MFGLTSSEGNRGEDVKEYYFYLDATPTGSYMKLLYKYPHAEYPYARLLDENRRRGGRRHGVRAARLRRVRRRPLLRHRHRVREGGSGRHLHPHRGVQPRARRRGAARPAAAVVPEHVGLGRRARAAARSSRAAGTVPGGRSSSPTTRARTRCRTSCSSTGSACATSTRRRAERRSSPTTRPTPKRSTVRRPARRSPFTKDAFHRQIVGGEACVNPDGTGTKACFHYQTSMSRPADPPCGTCG